MRVSFSIVSRKGSDFPSHPWPRRVVECRLALVTTHYAALELPDPFEDLTGVIGSDLKVIATALAERAGDRLLALAAADVINCGASSGTT